MPPPSKEERSFAHKLLRAMVEGVVTAILFGTAVLVSGSLLGMQAKLAGEGTSLIIAGCGALGLLLSGRLSLRSFDDR
jgi:hypothetical protein